ncbi:zinc-dependent alcohol dehydrogenase family protein [Comamonas antarctica]|nr:zinc-dependent alcohol dehydrogenase family protein [Comamonas antarctica]
MLATVMYGAGDVRVVNAPDPTLIHPTDAIVRVTQSCICGSDLWPYRDMAATDEGQSMGHEAVGVVEAVGKEVTKVRVGDTVIMPFAYSDGSCDFCAEGLHTACMHGSFFGYGGLNGAQAEALRIPYADGTLFPLHAKIDKALWPSILSLSDVMGTGHHAAHIARVAPGRTVAVIGDGAVGLCAVIAAKRLGAERIILLGRHPTRTVLGREFGATDIVAERGDEAVSRLMELTAGQGAHSVLECVGTEDSMVSALNIVRAGGAIGRVGVPHYQSIPAGQTFVKNVIVGGGPAPVRAYIEELLPDVLEGRIQPGRVFDRTISLSDAAEGYRAMDRREALKVLIAA